MHVPHAVTHSISLMAVWSPTNALSSDMSHQPLYHAYSFLA